MLTLWSLWLSGQERVFISQQLPGLSSSRGEQNELTRHPVPACTQTALLNGGQRREGDGDRGATGLLPWSLRQTLSWWWLRLSGEKPCSIGQLWRWWVSHLKASLPRPYSPENRKKSYASLLLTESWSWASPQKPHCPCVLWEQCWHRYTGETESCREARAAWTPQSPQVLC